MSVILEYIQYDEIIAKLNALLEKVADKETQLEIKALIESIRSLMAKEVKQDEVIEKLNDIATKLNSILSALGEPKPTYSVVLTAQAVGANRHHLVLFNNSQRKVVVRRITLNAETTGTVTGFAMSYRIHRISAVTGGTALPIQKYDTQDPDPVGIVAVALPTSVTIVGTLDSITINPEETGGQHSFERNYDAGKHKPIVLYPGQGITIQQYGTTGVGTLTAII
ncbi:MAG: hypothetical protein QXK07_04055, partial [Desulfurococcaceae archaeon]